MDDALALRRRCLADFRAPGAYDPALRQRAAHQRFTDYIICQYRDAERVYMPTKDYRTFGEDLVNVAVRLPQSILMNVDGHIAALRAMTPWARVGRSEALRDLILRGLNSLGTETAPVPTVVELQQGLPYPMSEEAQRLSTPEAPQTSQPGQEHKASRALEGKRPMTTAVAPSLPYDPAKYILGKLCRRGHNYQGTGQSLLTLAKRNCRQCAIEKEREKRQARRPIIEV